MSFRKSYFLLNEADDNEEKDTADPAEDTTAKDDNKGEEPTDDKEEEEPTDDKEEEPEDYQMDESDTEPPDMEDVESGEDMGEDTGDVDAETGEPDTTNLKKLILLGQYRELTDVLKNIIDSMDSLTIDIDIEKIEDCNYIETNLHALLDNINFTVRKRFIELPYQELLKYFYYFKSTLNNLVKLVENLIEE